MIRSLNNRVGVRSSPKILMSLMPIPLIPWNLESADLSQISAEDDGLHVLTDLKPLSS